MNFLVTPRVVDTWALLTTFLGGMLFATLLMIVIGLHYQVTVGRRRGLMGRLDRANDRLSVAQAQVDRALAQAATELANTAYAPTTTVEAEPWQG